MYILALLIANFCESNIEPRYDQNICIDMMWECIAEMHNSFDSCADYYDTDEE